MKKSKIIGEILIPFCSVSFYFWGALWYNETTYWTSRMYLALLVAVFFNYFLTRSLYNNLRGKKLTMSFLYTLLWELLAPVLLILLSIFSIIKEFQFYNWNVLMKSANEATFYLLIILILLFVYFLNKGLLMLKNK